MNNEWFQSSVKALIVSYLVAMPIALFTGLLTYGDPVDNFLSGILSFGSIIFPLAFIIFSPLSGKTKLLSIVVLPFITLLMFTILFLDTKIL